MTSVQRFDRLYFGDRVLKMLRVDIQERSITAEIDNVILLRDVQEPSIFDPQTTYEPAVVTFIDCKEFRVSDGSYVFNNTIVDFSATEIADGRVEFFFALTGGYNNETFWREITIVARDFSIRTAPQGSEVTLS